MSFEEVLDQAIDMLRRRGRLTYRTLKRQFALDDATLEDLKEELLFSHPVSDQEGQGLTWNGETDKPSAAPTSPASEPPAVITQIQPTPAESVSSLSPPPTPDAERRQLTVMFCDLVGSTQLSSQLDPEELRDVIQSYQQTAAEIIAHYDGYIAQYLGDGLLVYFGYPLAHEEDAQRAVRSGLDLLAAMEPLNTQLEQDRGVQLAVRIGIHTGLVVVGNIGGGERQEQLAMGETPNLAARIQSIAEPSTLAISAATYRLVQGYFDCESLGEHGLRGVSQPITLYRVLGDTGIENRLDVARPGGLTRLVGRQAELQLLLDRWRQATQGNGQVVLLNAEPGVGKSRMVQALREELADDSYTRLECRSLPYYQNTALFPLVERIQRTLQWEAHDSEDDKVAKLEQALSQYPFPLEETVPLMAGLLSLALPVDRYPPLNLSPQRLRQKTLETIVAIILALAAREPVLFIVEDLHWTDPSTLELLDLLIDQTPRVPLYTLLTCRPEFHVPWSNRSYLTQVTLNHLSREGTQQIATEVAGGKALPNEVIEQLVDKTDGVPLYVEEMTKAVLESGDLKASDRGYELTGAISTLSIPATLQDSLMSRLDRLVTAKGVVQYGAVIGRQFSYEVLRVVSRLDDMTLQRELGRLVAAELIHQRGISPDATYTFKHALIQDVAYESLLRRTRQQYHHRIAQVLESQLADIEPAAPELLAHHYTEAGLHDQAVNYWHQAGQQAIERSANEEALGHLTRGLELLEGLPDVPERMQQKLNLLVALGPVLLTIKGSGAPEVGQAYTRARELCQQVGESTALFAVTFGVWLYTQSNGQLETAQGLAEELFCIADQQSDPGLCLQAHHATWTTLHRLGNPSGALHHAEQGIALYNFDDHRTHAFRYAGHDPGVCCRTVAAQARWPLGYPDQALANVNDAVALAEKLSHPYSLAQALHNSTFLHQYRWEPHLVLERANRVIDVCREHGFIQYMSGSRVLRGWALAVESQTEDGIEEIHQGLTALQSIGARARILYYLALLADAYGQTNQSDQGLRTIAEALDLTAMTGGRTWEAELHRLKGFLLLQQSTDNAAEAEVCFQQAISIAQNQSAKSLELRAATSLAKLWQQRGKRQDTYDLLAPVYGWFTEGFDTADLQDARTLLDELKA